MGTILPLFTAALWLYAVLRFVWPLPVGPGVKIAAALILLLIAEYHMVTSRFFGSLASPELPQAVLIFLGWAFGAFLLLVMLLLVRDVAGVLLFVISRRVGTGLLAGGLPPLIIGAAAALLAAYGVWQAVKVPAVKTVELMLSGLPAAFDGYRVVQLTDLHASRLLPAPWVAAVVDKTNALEPDLIVITGDLQDGSPEARAPDVRPLRELKARDGVLAIPGNHEYYADYQRWMDALRALGLHMLENQHVRVAHRGAELAVAGITDRQAGAFGELRPDVDAALDGIPPGTTTILLSHRPVGARNNARAGIALQLSGHTHGGQILGPHLLTRWANEGFVSGLYQVGPMTLYVSNGTGLWNGLAIRLGRPSEITQFVLHPAPE